MEQSRSNQATLQRQQRAIPISSAAHARLMRSTEPSFSLSGGGSFSLSRPAFIPPTFSGKLESVGSLESDLDSVEDETSIRTDENVSSNNWSGWNAALARLSLGRSRQTVAQESTASQNIPNILVSEKLLISTRQLYSILFKRRRECGDNQDTENEPLLGSGQKLTVSNWQDILTPEYFILPYIYAVGGIWITSVSIVAITAIFTCVSLGLNKILRQRDVDIVALMIELFGIRLTNVFITLQAFYLILSCALYICMTIMNFAALGIGFDSCYLILPIFFFTLPMSWIKSGNHCKHVISIGGCTFVFISLTHILVTSLSRLIGSQQPLVEQSRQQIVPCISLLLFTLQNMVKPSFSCVSRPPFKTPQLVAHNFGICLLSLLFGIIPFLAFGNSVGFSFFISSANNPAGRVFLVLSSVGLLLHMINRIFLLTEHLQHLNLPARTLPIIIKLVAFSLINFAALLAIKHSEWFFVIHSSLLSGPVLMIVPSFMFLHAANRLFDITLSLCIAFIGIFTTIFLSGYTMSLLFQDHEAP